MNATQQRPPNSHIYQLGNMRPYIVHMLEQEGRISDYMACEECLKPIDGNKWEIHHTKYAGATYYDLLVVCLSCNRIEANCGLN